MIHYILKFIISFLITLYTNCCHLMKYLFIYSWFI
jgi:hypothetical protein